MVGIILPSTSEDASADMSADLPLPLRFVQNRVGNRWDITDIEFLWWMMVVVVVGVQKPNLGKVRLNVVYLS